MSALMGLMPEPVRGRGQEEQRHHNMPQAPPTCHTNVSVHSAAHPRRRHLSQFTVLRLGQARPWCSWDRLPWQSPATNTSKQHSCTQVSAAVLCTHSCSLQLSQAPTPPLLGSTPVIPHPWAQAPAPAALMPYDCHPPTHLWQTEAPPGVPRQGSCLRGTPYPSLG
jgi:hypothetical protein